MTRVQLKLLDGFLLGLGFAVGCLVATLLFDLILVVF